MNRLLVSYLLILGLVSGLPSVDFNNGDTLRGGDCVSFSVIEHETLYDQIGFSTDNCQSLLYTNLDSCETPTHIENGQILLPSSGTYQVCLFSTQQPELLFVTEIEVARPLSRRVCTPRTLTESFDDVNSLTSLWTIAARSANPGTTTIFQGTSAFFSSYEGTGYLAMNYENQAGTGTLSTWLISPVLDLSNGVTGSFYSRTISSVRWPDRLYVRYSTQGSDLTFGTGPDSLGVFVNQSRVINPSLTKTGYPSIWTKYTINIPALGAGVTGRIAFHYYMPEAGYGKNSNYIGIDSLTLNDCVSPASISSSGGTTSPILQGAASTTDASLACAVTTKFDGFETFSVVIADGWSELVRSNTNGTFTPDFGTTSYFSAHQGTAKSYVGVKITNPAVTGVVSSWFISPVYNFTYGMTATFWTRTVANAQLPNRAYLRYSTQGSNLGFGTGPDSLGAFTNQILVINEELTNSGYPSVWTQYTVTVPALGGGITGRIGFHYYVPNTGAGTRYIGIDTVTFNYKDCAPTLEGGSTTTTGGLSTTTGSTTGGMVITTGLGVTTTATEVTTTGTTSTTGSQATATTTASSTTTTGSEVTTTGTIGSEAASTAASTTGSDSTTAKTTGTTGSEVTTTGTTGSDSTTATTSSAATSSSSSVATSSSSVTSTSSSVSSSSSGVASTSSSSVSTSTGSTTGNSDTISTPLNSLTSTIISLPPDVTIIFPPMNSSVVATVTLATGPSSDITYQDPTLNTPGFYRGISFFVTLVPSQQPPSPIIFQLGSGQLNQADTAYLYNLDSKQWEKASETCGDKAEISLQNGVLNLTVCHLTQFAVFSNAGAGVIQQRATPSEGTSTTSIVLITLGVILFVILVLAALVVAVVYRRNKQKKALMDLESSRSTDTQQAIETVESQVVEPIEPVVIIPASKESDDTSSDSEDEVGRKNGNSESSSSEDEEFGRKKSSESSDDSESEEEFAKVQNPVQEPQSDSESVEAVSEDELQRETTVPQEEH